MSIRSEEEIVAFMYHMDSIWNICGKEVIQAFDLSEFHTICDLGGNIKILIYKLLMLRF